MSPDKQRIAIAEACPFVDSLDGRLIWNPGDGEPINFDPLNDLNAMHEAEKALQSRNVKAKFNSQLFKAVHGREHDYIEGETADDVFDVYGAAAAQRAEAFLRTIGKWEDDK